MSLEQGLGQRFLLVLFELLFLLGSNSLNLRRFKVHLEFASFPYVI